MPEQNNKLGKATELKRAFSYRKGAVSLDLTLNIDTPEQCKDFLEIVEAVKVDINKELSNFSK